MNNDGHLDKPMPNKLIPRSLRKRLPIQDEVKAARTTLAYWWYRCLAIHTGYLTCCEHGGKGKFSGLYADMGDVRLPFSSWWMKHGRRAFAEQQPLKDVLCIKTGKQADEQLDRTDVLVLSVPLTMRKATAMRKIGLLLTAAHNERPPLDIWKASSAKRMIVKSKIRKTTITQLLTLQELRLKHPYDSLSEIGVRAGIELDLLKRDTKGEVITVEMERRRMTIAVSRLLKQARHLIDNAALGVFPSLSPPDKASLSG